MVFCYLIMDILFILILISHTNSQDVKYMLDQSRLSGVPINIVLEDFRLSELSIDDTKSVLADVELLSKLSEIETDIFGNNNVSKLNNVKSIDIDL